MGIGIQGAKALVAARERGVSFRKMLTLGHQDLSETPATIEALLRAHGIDPRTDTREGEDWRFADPFFERLGAEQVDSLDASGYEHSSVVHDLNQRVPDHLHGSYDLVFDGGTLEHVFNFPVALENCMKMVRVGGHFITQAPGNNWFGHGFYQFSPELFFRVFCAENGFALERLCLAEVFPGGHFYEMKDPASVRKRAETRTPHPILVCVEARKQSDVATLFQPYPQQSDYAKYWEDFSGEAAPGRSPSRPPRRRLADPLVSWNPALRYWLNARRDLRRIRRRSFERMRAFYTRVES